jgi:hypothetical protein
MLGLKNGNSVCSNFRSHGIKKRPTPLDSIPPGLPNPRAWKIRFHKAITYDCDENAGASIQWNETSDSDVLPELFDSDSESLWGGLWE